MHATDGGAPPSGYYGSGYGFAQNRLSMAVPLPPTPQRLPAQGPQTVPSNMPINLPFEPAPGAPPVQTVSAPVPAIGHPIFHIAGTQEPAIGVLGMKFGRTSSGWRVY